LTDLTIQKAVARDAADAWLSDGGQRGAGALYLRVRHGSGNKSFYYRYLDSDAKRVSLRLGEYNQKGHNGRLSLADARARAGELSQLYLSGVKDIKGHLDDLARAAERARVEQAAAERKAAEDAARGTLRELLDAYVADLTRRQRSNAQSVAGDFARHVYTPFADLSATKAANIKAADIQRILKRLLAGDKPKGRTAGRLRSYMHAAFAAALSAEFDPSAADDLRGFALEYNPVSAIKSLSQFQRAGERVLSEEELAIYLRELEGLSWMTGRALELALYLGGQRPEQLLRVSPADVHFARTHAEIVLRDPKGRRATPRLHVLPLIGRARSIVDELLRMNGDAAFLLGIQREHGMAVATLSSAVRRISSSLLALGRIRAPFQQRDIRRTAETQLARLRVPKTVRAQLLSHGLGGVQDRHYDRHDYLDEKTEALRTWSAYLDELRGA
jgi:hypothetical protein